MTHLRKMMLEEFQRRNCSKHTAEAYIRAPRDFAIKRLDFAMLKRIIPPKPVAVELFDLSPLRPSR